MDRQCEGAMDISHEKTKENTHKSTKETQEKIPQNPNKDSQKSSDDSHESNQDSQKHLQESSKGSEENNARESGKEYQQESGNSQLYWGILEELLLACLVRKHGTHDWTLVTAGLDDQLRRRGQNQSFTAEVCRAQFYAIKSRYTTEEDSVEDRAPDDMPWLEELVHLWKAELRRQIVRHDNAIEMHQNEIIRLQSLRGENSNLACMQEYPNAPAASQLHSGARVEYSSDAHAPLQHRSDIARLPDSTRGSSIKDIDEVIAKEVEEVDVATVTNSLGNVDTSTARLGSLPISVQEGALEHDDGTSLCVKAPFDALDSKEQPNSAIQWDLEHDDSGTSVCVKAPSADALHAKEPPNSSKNEVTDLQLQEDDTQKTGQETSGSKPDRKVAFISEDAMPKRRPGKKRGKSTRKTWKPIIKDVKEERDATDYLKSIIESSVKTKLITTSHGVNESMQALRVKEETEYITEESHQMERHSLDSGVVKCEDVSFVIAGKEDMPPMSRREKKNTRIARKPNPPLVECLRMISKHNCAAIFQRTQESQDNTRYASLIRDPVDIPKVRARLEEGQYLGSLHFFRDLLLMVTNASVYYGVNAPEFKAASGLRGCIKEEMKVVFEREDLQRDCRRRVSKGASLIKPSTQSHVSVQVDVSDDDDDDAGDGTRSAKLEPSCLFVYRKGDLKTRRGLALLPNKGEESSHDTVTHAAVPVHQPDVVQEATQRGEGGRPPLISQQQQTPQKLRQSEAAHPPRRKRVRR